MAALPTAKGCLHCARLALEPFVELHFFAGTDKELIKRN
jgi:hypothetical protein